MLKRNDLAKQFEDIVKQEVINHTLAIEANNGAMRDLFEGIDKLSEKLSSNVARIDSKAKKICIEVANVKGDLNSANISIDKNLRSTNKDHKDLEKNFKKTKYSAESFHEKLLDMNSLFESLSLICLNVTERITRLEKESREELDNFFNKISLALPRLEQDILSRPVVSIDEFQELKTKLSEKTKDFKGVTKELRDIKKHAFYLEKKIEDIYISIGRKGNGG